MAVSENGNAPQLFYTYTDHLGSITAVTNQAGAVIARQNFDAWGRRRNALDYSYLPQHTTNIDNGISASGNLPQWLYRGYTGHEHLDEFALINMNARLYDPVLGMMLSPDNYIQDPSFTQNYNRYGYCFNNPMRYTDPDGNVVWFVPVIIGAAIGAYAGASIQSGTLNPTDWSSDSWKGAIVGGIVGAGLGYLAATALPAIGVSVTTASGATAFGSGVTATAGMTITSQALVSGNIGIASNYIQGRGLEGAWKGGLLGVGTGVLTAGVGMSLANNTLGLSNEMISSISNATGSGVYGAIDRNIRLREQGVHGPELARYTLLGFFEGASVGALSGVHLGDRILPIAVSGISSSITAFPGLGYSFLDYHTLGLTRIGGFQKYIKKQSSKYPKEVTLDDFFNWFIDKLR
jgi:RHS repeat-associated protein